MRNLKKLFAVVIAVAMMVTAMAPAFAAGAFSYEAEAQVLNDLGLYKGISETEFVPDLGTALNRETGVVMLLRIFGLEADAEAIADADAVLAKFKDAASISSWAKKAVAYAVENGLVQGNPDSTFAPKAALNGKAYSTLILRQLGYTPDYNNAPAELADKGGLTVLEAVKFTSKELVKDDLVGISYGALKAEYSDGATVIEKLIEANPDMEEVATTAGLVEELTITALASVPAVKVKVGATADLAKTVTATYSDKTTAEVAVTWDAVDTTKAGTVTVAGTVEGTELKASVTVTVEEVVLAVESATVLNAKQIKVVFNKDLDSTKATTKANYVVNAQGASVDLMDGAGSDAALQSDKKTVILTLETGANLVDFTTTNKLVVKKDIGIAADYTNAALALTDTTLPTVVKAEAVGTKTITVTFSEPVKDANNTNILANLKVDSSAYGLNEATATFSVTGYSLTFDVYTDLSAGTHKVEIVNGDLVDYVNLAVIPTTVEFTYAKDTTLPTVTLESSTETMAKIKFNKPVNAAKDVNVKYSHTYKGSNSVLGNVAAVNKVDDSTYEITFATPFPPGASTLFITYVDGNGTKITDKYGNVFAEASLPINTVADLTAPTISDAASIKLINSTTLEVTFTENVDLTTSQDATKYVLKDSTGAVISILGVVRQADNKVVRITTTTLNGGSYTLAVKDVKDTAVAANAMAEKSIGFSINDAILPTVADLKTAGTATDALLIGTKKVKIGFSEAMKKETIESKSNYLFQGADLEADVTVTAAADLKSVIIDFTNAATQNPVATNVIAVGRVEDSAGNKIAALSTDATIQTRVAPTFSKVQIVAKNQVKVIADTVITGYSTKDFAIDVDGNAATVFKAPASIISGTVNSDGKTEIVLQTQDDMIIGSWAAGNEPQVMTVADSSLDATTQAAAGGAQDEFSAKLNIAATDLEDKAAPTLASTDPVYTADMDGDGRIDAIVVKFNENIARTSLSDTTFAVTGRTVTMVTTDADGDLSAGVGGADGAWVVIAISEVTDAGVYDTNSVPTITKVGSVKDAGGNVFDGLTTATASVDKAAPVVVSWKVKTNSAVAADFGDVTDAIELTYSEPVILGFAAADATKAEFDALYTLKDSTPDTAALAGTTVMTHTGNTTKIVTLTVKTTDFATDIQVAQAPTLDTLSNSKVKDANNNNQLAKAAIAVTP